MRGVWGERGVGVCGMKGVKGCDSRVRYRNDKGGRDLVTHLNTTRNKIRKLILLSQSAQPTRTNVAHTDAHVFHVCVCSFCVM